MISDLEEKLSGIIPDENILKNEDMSRHTTFKTGGPADYFLRINNKETLFGVYRVLRECGADFFKDFYVVGNCSNLLVSDKGYSGVILSLTGDFTEGKLVDDTHIRAGAGASNASIANLAAENSLTGFEFAHGIPGTIGGAIIMNAGAYGGEMKQVVQSVTFMDEKGNIVECSGEDAKFGYRTSAFKGQKCILIDAVIGLKKGNADVIRDNMKDLMERRRSKQPLDYPSAGSTFKRPEGYFAGKLIEDAGLRGYTVGGAKVSEKHCGFIVNSGGATSSDVDALIKKVQEIVLKTSGVQLQPEVIRLGEF